MTAHEKLTDELQPMQMLARYTTANALPFLLVPMNGKRTYPKADAMGEKSKIAYADRCHTNDGHLSRLRW